MQFAMQDVRKWGYIKLGQKFFSDEHHRIQFFDELSTILQDLCDIRCSAYSFPRRWCVVKDLCTSRYVGLRNLMYFCEPMINNITSLGACQRKFRDKWTSLWDEFCEVVGLTPWERSLLGQVGLLLAFSEKSYAKSTAKDIIRFFNSVILWYVFAQSEQNLVKVAETPLNFVSRLVSQTADEFELWCILRSEG